MGDREMTIFEGLQECIDTLRDINVPVALHEQIAEPLMKTVNMLTGIHNVLVKWLGSQTKESEDE